RSSATLPRAIGSIFARGGDIFSKLLLRQLPQLGDMLVPALQTTDTTVNTPQPIDVYAVRTRARLFGGAAPDPFVSIRRPESPGISAATTRAAALKAPLFYTNLTVGSAWDITDDDTQTFPTIPLDATYDQVKPEGNEKSWVIIDPDP